MTAATPPSSSVSFDLIVYGDEVPGLLALVCAARDYRRQTGKNLRTLVLSKGNSQDDLGGHLIRGRLAYLDRSHIPSDIRQSDNIPVFGDPVSIYKEFLNRAGVYQIALDPPKANIALRNMLQEVGANLINNVQIESVIKTDNKISSIKLTNGSTFLGKHFIDCTVNAELALFAGVQKLRGFETFGLPDSELCVTLVFETEGLTVQRLKDIEFAYLKRFTNPSDTRAQNMINIAAGSNPTLADRFRRELLDAQGRLRTMAIGPDFIDVTSRALSIAYHAFRGRRLSLADSGAILDQGNIAILNPNKDRLAWNALLFFVNSTQAEELARAGAKPTKAMLAEMAFVERFFQSFGATAVKSASELYIRHAGNVTGVVDPLTGAEMLSGGVPANEALGTFSYHLDVRGGIHGLGAKAANKGIKSISFFTPPTFNIGIRHALVKDIPNLAVISPGSGFYGYASAAGRIVEYNVGVGQGVGIAVSLAQISDRHLGDITNLDVRKVLETTRQLTRIFGKSHAQEAKRMNEFEIGIA
ncbi:MAG: FAD-dependent oxidoreductase [Nostocaceae cyanobacterium]|nr:FAD-dependent oxidoreductase [Nostocaceae cyanobacterium]